MSSKIADSLLVNCLNQIYSHSTNHVPYDKTYSFPKSKALKRLNSWTESEALILFLESGGIDVKDTEVLDLVADMMQTRKFKVFLLGINNCFKKYNLAQLGLVEDILLKNIPAKMQIIIYSNSPSTDVYADWFQKINTTFRIDYSAFGYLFNNKLSLSNQMKILESFHHPNCKAKGIDVRAFASSAQVDVITKCFSEQKHELQLMRLLKTNGYASASILEKAVKTAAAKKLLPEGIHLRDKNRQWQTFNFAATDYVQNILSLKALNLSHIERNSRLFFLGDKESGKTSTVRTLLGMPFAKKLLPTSTGCIDTEAKIIINQDPTINWKSGEDLTNNDDAQLNIVDFKGGPRMIAFERILMTEPSIFIVCFKLQTLLTNEAETVADLCEKVKIIQEMSHQSFAVLVATHAKGTRAEEIYRINVNALKSFGNAKLRIVWSKSENLAFHILENSTALNSSKHQVMAIKTTISKIIFGFPVFQVKVPNWIPSFCDILIDNFNGNKSEIKLELVLGYAKQFGLTPEEVDSALKLGHRLGSLLYFGDETPGRSKSTFRLVLNVNSLLHAFGRFIYDAHATSKCYDVLKDVMEGIIEYETEGILHYDVFLFLTADLDELMRELIVHLSLLFGIMLKPEDPRTARFNVKLTDSKSFLVPSMLPGWKDIIDLPKILIEDNIVDSGEQIPMAEEIFNPI